MKPYLYLDFEYFNTKERYVRPVCWVAKKNNVNLVGDDKRFPYSFLTDHMIVSYNIQAEVRALLSYYPAKELWSLLKDNTFCLFLCNRYLSNHTDKHAYGKHIIQGKKKFTCPPPNKYQLAEMEEDEASNHAKSSYGYSDACYHWLGVEIDNERKTAMRDIIISGDMKLINDNMTEILEYCEDDVKYLPLLHSKFLSEMTYADIQRVVRASNYAILTAIMEAEGYPVRVEELHTFAENVEPLLNETRADINSQFLDNPPFKFNKKDLSYSMNQQNVFKFIDSLPFKSEWPRSDKTFKYSLKSEVWEKYFPTQHSYKRGSYGEQVVRFLKTKQHLNGFLSSKRGSIFDYLGSDGRVRPYFNIYGAQSGRSQPSATSYIPLKSAWMRCLIQPEKGRTIIGMDYSSQEFLISAIMSNCQNMVDAYCSGDVYLYFAKMAGAVPMDGKKENYKKERNLFKATCLAEGSLIRVKDKGFKKIEDITSEDEVYNGLKFSKCSGSKFMGVKETSILNTTYYTEDHLILGEDSEWRERKDYQESEVCKGKVLQENTGGLYWPSYSWSDVWSMASLILRNKLRKKI